MGRLNVKFHLLMLLFVLKFHESSTHAETVVNANQTRINRKQITLVSLQRNNRNLKRHFKSTSKFLTVLILLAGDIESNPGPDHVKRVVPELDRMLQK